MPEFSVVIIVKGRRTQLHNVLDSIERAGHRPHDIHIVCMDDTDGIHAPAGLNVTIHDMASGDELPLAAARNHGMRAIQTDIGVFIDVDCIVSPTLFDNMLQDVRGDTVITAYPLYLSSVPDTGNFEALRSLAVAHPNRERLPVKTPVAYYEFWSLIFAMRKTSFDDVGGFDESFTGYGAEDTDFAKTFDEAGFKLSFVKDYVLHQYHDKYDPPLNYFDAIITNATTYKRKWGTYPMGSWLKAFASMGLIEYIPDESIKVLRRPTESEIGANVSKMPY